MNSQFSQRPLPTYTARNTEPVGTTLKFLKYTQSVLVLAAK
jgi:hypothetical protein